MKISGVYRRFAVVVESSAGSSLTHHLGSVFFSFFVVTVQSFSVISDSL